MSARKIVMRIVSISFTVLVIVLIIFALTKLGNGAYTFGYRIFTEPPVGTEESEDVVVQIEQGMDASDIGELLEEKGLIRDSELFFAQVKLSAYSKTIKPGVYTLNPNMTAKEMMQVMSPTEKETETEAVPEAVTEEAEEVTEEETQTEG